MANTKTTSGGLNFTYPAKNKTNYSPLFDVLWAQISAHDHEGGGLGTTLTGDALQDGSIPAAKIQFDNDEYLKATDFAGTGTINIVKVTTADKLAFGATITSIVTDAFEIANNTWVSATDTAGTGVVKLIRADASDNVEIGADSTNIILSNTVTIQTPSGTDSKTVYSIDSTDKWHTGVDEDDSDTFKVGTGAAVGTSTVVDINTNGAQTLPFQPAFCAFSAAQSNVTGDGTAYIITFNANERFDQSSSFDGTTFTAPKTGNYRFDVSVEFDGYSQANNTNLTVEVVTSNQTYRLFWKDDESISTSGQACGGCLADMDASDTAQIIITAGGSAKGIDIGVRSFVCGSLVC